MDPCFVVVKNGHFVFSGNAFYIYHPLHALGTYQFIHTSVFPNLAYMVTDQEAVSPDIHALVKEEEEEEAVFIRVS